MNDLPRRRVTGYQVTGVRLVLETTRRGARAAVSHSTQLPLPPADPLNEVQLAAFVSSLTGPAVNAAAELARLESAVRRKPRTPAHDRVQIRVFSRDEVIGVVTGAAEAYGPRGDRTAIGIRIRPDTRSRNKGYPRPKRTHLDSVH